MKRILLLVFLLSAFGQAKAASSEIQFRCKESKNISENTAQLARWGIEIENEVQELERIDDHRNSISIQDKQNVVNLIRKTLCFSQVQGDATIFEHLMPLRSKRFFQAALKELTFDEQRKVSEAFELSDF